MADRSAIEWTEATWNPVTGCSKVSPGCAHCYAETFAERRRGIPKPPLRAGLRPQALASAPRAAAQVAPGPRGLRELDERPLPRRHPRQVHSRRLRGYDLARRRLSADIGSRLANTSRSLSSGGSGDAKPRLA